MIPLSRSFYIRPTLQVAKNLLGKNIICLSSGKLMIGKIVEVEAYRKNDPASHSYKGKTRRNEVMFKEGGHLYVYFTYGMHFCANIVTGKDEVGEAVLIRAVEPLTGIEVMAKNRYGSKKSPNPQHLNLKSLINLTNGPAKFCEAFDITRNENGLDLIDSKIIITNGKKIAPGIIGKTTRVGIRVGMEKKWRFFIKMNPWVSRKKV